MPNTNFNKHNSGRRGEGGNGATNEQTSKPPWSGRIVFYDALRNFFVGSLLPLTEVVLMLYFINHLNGNTMEKTFLAMSIKSGYLISLPISLYLMRHGLAVKNSLSLLLGISLGAVLLSLVANSTWLLILLAAAIGLSLHGTHTIASEIYSSYPKKTRGKLASFSNIALFLGSIVFTFTFRQTIEEELNFPAVVIISAIALLLAIMATRRIQLPPIIEAASQQKKTEQQKTLHLGSVIDIVKNDKMFVRVITAWMLLGLANLWLLPYRTNLLVEDSFGFMYDEKMVLLLLVAIPETIYVLFSIPFGIFFDRFNFISLRIVINLLFIAYYMFFFFGANIYFHITGMLCFGLARAGGSIAWKMWINKMVPAEKVPLYMTMHMAATGLRMVGAPLLGLVGLYTLGPTVCGIISVVFMSTSIAMFIPLIKHGKRFKH